MITNGQKYLVTSDNWFLAPDGEEYRAAWGVCHIKTINDLFDVTPLRPSTNWFIQIGEGENLVIMAGCQIHYAVKCDRKPNRKYGKHDIPGQQINGTVINKIFFTDAKQRIH